MHSYIPGYIRARQTGRLQKAVQLALDMLCPCTLCPRQCRVNRTGNETGYCGTGRLARVARFSTHFGEEPPLVGDLKTDRAGVACSGLLVRHLVMPGRLEDTRQILEFLKTRVSPDTHVNLMSQYRPMGEAYTVSELNRPLSVAESRKALQMGKTSGLTLVR
ncbi:MAG TPA: hypothetical protein VK885_09285 [Desulfotignum sp.]|nr:hypothetical protein [Desulfotignum sp.]